MDSLLTLAGDRQSAEGRGIPWTHDETGLSYELPSSSDPLLLDLNRRIYRAVGIDNDFDATLRVRRYRAGEFHPPHCDHFEAEGRALLATAMLHLCDTAAGGETRFTEARPQPFCVTPKRGRLVVWLNHGADGRPDLLSRHEGLPVRAGEKITVTNFLYKPRSSALLFASR